MPNVRTLIASGQLSGALLEKATRDAAEEAALDFVWDTRPCKLTPAFPRSDKPSSNTPRRIWLGWIESTRLNHCAVNSYDQKNQRTVEVAVATSHKHRQVQSLRPVETRNADPSRPERWPKNSGGTE